MSNQLLTRVTSPPKSNTGGSRLIFSVPFSYFLFTFYLPRLILPDFPSESNVLMKKTAEKYRIYYIAEKRIVSKLSKISIPKVNRTN